MSVSTIAPSERGLGAAHPQAGKEAVVGLSFNGIQEYQPGQTFFGATIATHSFYEALFRHGERHNYALFCDSGREEAVREQLWRSGSNYGDRKNEIGIHTAASLIDRFDTYSFSAWHEPGGVFVPPFYLRSIRAKSLFPVTFTHHTISYSSQLPEFYLRLLMSETYPFDSVVCTSRPAREAFVYILNYVRERFRETFGGDLPYRGRFDIIPLGVDTDIFRPRDKDDLRLQLGLPRDALLVLWLGRFSISDKMDLAPVLRCFRDLTQANPNRKLVFVLAGSERGNYRGFIQAEVGRMGIADKVLVMGNLPTQTRLLLHAAADIFVSPSDNIQESYGITPVEAMACGVPQVVSDWDGYRDTVKHGVTGFRVPTYWARCDGDLREPAPIRHWEIDHLRLAESVVIDPRAYQRYLQILIENDELRAEMGRQSRQRALSLFSWQAVIRQYEDLWRELGERASGWERTPTAHSRFLQPPYFDAFQGYASALLADETPLTLTPEGTRVLRGTSPMPTFPGKGDCFKEETLKQILSAVKVARRFGKGYEMNKLVLDLCAIAPPPAPHPDAVRRHVLWLMKYGLVEPTGGYPLDPDVEVEK